MTPEEARRELEFCFDGVPLPTPVVLERKVCSAVAMLGRSDRIALEVRNFHMRAAMNEVRAGERDTAWALYSCVRVEEADQKPLHAAMWASALLHDVIRKTKAERLFRYDRGFYEDCIDPLEWAVRDIGFGAPWHHASTALPSPNPLGFLYPGELAVPDGECSRESFLPRLAALCATFCNAYFTPIIVVWPGEDKPFERRTD